MNQYQKQKINKFYSIDEEEKTASVVGFNGRSDSIFIPRFIEHKSRVYFVTSLSKNSIKYSLIKSIQFASDSKVKTIGKFAFFSSSLEILSIPSSLTNLDDFWCYETPNFNKIELSPDNPKFMYLNDQLLIEKSQIDSNRYDTITFCARNAASVTIPKGIKTIRSCSFNGCSRLFSIEFPIDSELETIEKSAFSFSSTESLSLPSSLVELEEGWCYEADCLNHINVSSSNPKFCAFDEKLLLEKSSLNLRNYDILNFCIRNIQTVKIPTFIKVIGPYAFNHCHDLYDVQIPTDSELQIIGKSSFEESIIERFTIPPHVTKICENAFSQCSKLRHVEIPENSELRTIESCAFAYCGIESFTIPAGLVELEKGWCQGKRYLRSFNVSEKNPYFIKYNNKVILKKSSIDDEFYDRLVICARNVRFLTIPNFVKVIESFAFNYCDRLFHVELQMNSQLQKINEYAFAWSSIDSFVITSNIQTIGKNAFVFCYNLRHVDVENNSNLRVIDKLAFSESLISSFFVPSTVTVIETNAFSCENLKIIEFDKNPELKLKKGVFGNIRNLIVMIPAKCHFILY